MVVLYISISLNTCAFFAFAALVMMVYLILLFAIECIVDPFAHLTSIPLVGSGCSIHPIGKKWPAAAVCRSVLRLVSGVSRDAIAVNSFQAIRVFVGIFY
jgi:hypothetical protein